VIGSDLQSIQENWYTNFCKCQIEIGEDFYLKITFQGLSINSSPTTGESIPFYLQYNFIIQKVIHLELWVRPCPTPAGQSDVARQNSSIFRKKNTFLLQMEELSLATPDYCLDTPDYCLDN
jgi:hypothetical protein